MSRLPITDFIRLEAHHLKLIGTCQDFIQNGSRYCRNPRLAGGDYCRLHDRHYPVVKEFIPKISPFEMNYSKCCNFPQKSPIF